jgi:alkyl hydroperoxide reductase subunit AhpC
MALQIGAVAPDFEAETTEGKIKFHDWIGNDWALLFSHPKDFTPVCTTELGALAKLKPEFDKRGVKLMGLSVDPVDRHSKWSEDIKETQGAAPNYPMIGDTDLKVSKLYDMLPASASGDVLKRTAADNQTVRNVFIIGPDKTIRLVLVYPIRPQFPGNPAGHRLASDDRETPDFDPGGLEARRGRYHFRVGQRRRSQKDLPAGLEIAEAVYPDRAAAEVRMALSAPV